MDILAARKKAAERAKARKESATAEPPPEPPEGPAGGDEPSHPAGERETPPKESDFSDPPRTENSSPPGPEQPDAPGPSEEPSESEEEERSAEPDETPAADLELLSFRLGGEEYAVMVEDVREVLKVFQMTPVPNAPDYILGVVSLRGIITPIIDLGKRLGLLPVLRDEKSRIIVVHAEGEHLGILVDRVTGVLRIPPGAVKAPPDNIEKGAEFLRGIARKDDKLYILLDLDKTVGA